MPDVLTGSLGLPELPYAWAVVIGMTAFIIGYYDIVAGKNNVLPLIKASVYMRFGFAIGAVLLFATSYMPATAILLGGIDALGAAWTFMALRSEN